jgi:tRNA(Ile)-lysidine synthase
MNLLQQFEKNIRNQNLSLQTDRLLLAVSGGIDSVVLCELCKQAGLNFSIAHCNFSLRGEESERDEQFVRSLGEKYGVRVWVKKFDTNRYAVENSISVQEAARNLRYQWFAGLRKEEGFARTLLAHHADDNMETLLMNFFRGTGLQGLTGIPAGDKKSGLLRPLLHFRKNEIEAFAKENHLQWAEDSSNLSVKYTRNFFRHELLPAVKKAYPQAEENLLNNIERFKKANAVYQSCIEKLKQEVCEQGPAEMRMPVKKLLRYSHTSLVYEIIKEYGFGEKQVDEVMKLTAAESGKFIENGQYQIIKHGNWLVIAQKAIHADMIAIEKGRQQIQFSGGVLELRFIAKDRLNLSKSASVAQLDAKHIEFPLLLRKWKQGDYFYPLGMPKKKKLARFLIDQKLSKNQKENVWVIESNKKILWVAGMRIDDRFKIVPSTEEILQLTLE